MQRHVVYVYDANPIDLRGRKAQLVEHLRHAGALAEWEVRATSSRNALLLAIQEDSKRAPRTESTTLIDLRAETGDLEQRGFRICETVVRSPALNSVTRPLIWTDFHTASNFRRAQQVGAIAVIDDAWVDGGVDGPLAQVLSWASKQPASPSAAIGSATRVFPADTSSLEAERARRDQVFQAWFGFAPMDLHFALLWGMADAVQLSFLERHLASRGIAGSERIAKRERENLEAAMADRVREMERPGPARAEVARRFLAEAIPPEPSPLDEISWPRLEHLRELLEARPDVVGWAFHPPGGEELLRRFFACLEGTGGSVAERQRAIENATSNVAAARNVPPTEVAEAVRTHAQAVDDAFMDWREYGEPGPIG